MHQASYTYAQIRTGNKTGIWLALLIAFLLHSVILLLPVTDEGPGPTHESSLIELELTRFEPDPAPPLEEQQTELLAEEVVPEPRPKPEPVPDIAPEQERAVAEVPAEVLPETPDTSSLSSAPLPVEPRRPFELLSEPEKKRLANTLLSRQFITEKPVVEEIFGKPVVDSGMGVLKDFQYPVRPNMIAMLDKPLPDMPFAYQEGLIHFAYDPGVKGDLQRFWDVITPEFGWRTKYGTEVRCIWVLVIAACGWK